MVYVKLFFSTFCSLEPSDACQGQGQRQGQNDRERGIGTGAERQEQGQ